MQIHFDYFFCECFWHLNADFRWIISYFWCCTEGRNDSATFRRNKNYSKHMFQTELVH